MKPSGTRITTKLTMRAAIALVIASAGAAWCLATPSTDIFSTGPLTHIWVGNDLSCQVQHIADAPDYEFFPRNVIPGDSGTFIAMGGVLYAPDFANHDNTATDNTFPNTPFTPASPQSPVTGFGTTADPFKVVTVVDVGATGLRIQQTDTYTTGQEYYTTEIMISNNGFATASGVLYRAGDAFLAGSDTGYGFAELFSGNLPPPQQRKAVGCSVTENNSPPGKIEEFIPITGGNNYFQDQFDIVWSAIGSKAPFPDTVSPYNLDNGAGISWNFSIPPAGFATYSHVTTFSPLGKEGLVTSKTADIPTTVPAGTQTGYTITIQNPNDSDVIVGPITVNSITDSLPDGFVYVPGSTTGVTTNEPTIAPPTLTWSGSFTVVANSSISLHFAVTVAATPGDYFNEAGGSAEDGFNVIATGPTAKITVTEAPTPTPTATVAATATATATAAATATFTPAATATFTPAATATFTPTATATFTPTPATPSPTPTLTPCALGSCAPPYPFVSANPQTNIAFNESEVLRTFRMTVDDNCFPQTLQMFYNDEHAMTLGVRKIAVKTSSGTTTTSYPVAIMNSNPDGEISPVVGSTIASGDPQAGTDVAGRPMFPAMFVTDTTANSGNALAGDWQNGGTAINPDAVFGTWKAAVKTIDQTKNPATVTVTPDADPAKNNWNLGPGSDPVPAGLTNEGYGAECRWDLTKLSLVPGHVYRLYFMVHDGDQNKTGGDVGQACVYFVMPGTAPTPTPTATATFTPTPSPTSTATATSTPTPTATPTPTPTPTTPPAAALVASASGTNRTVTTPAFTLKANTTYLVFAFTNSAKDDSATPTSSVAIDGQTFNTIGLGSMFYNGKDNEFGWWFNSGASDATGTISVTFVKDPAKAYVQVIELYGNDTLDPIAQSAYASGNNTNPYTANLPAPPLASNNFDVYFLNAHEDLGGTALTGTPAVTNLVWAKAAGGTAGTYFKDAESQNQSFAGPNKHWATIAVEIKRP